MSKGFPVRTVLYQNIQNILKDEKIIGFLIFRDWILKSAGIDDEQQPYCYFSGKANEEDLGLNINGLPKEDKTRLLQFLKMDTCEADYIDFDETLISQQLLPAFKVDTTNLRQFFSDNEIKKYQLLSKDKIDKENAASFGANAKQIARNYLKLKSFFTNASDNNFLNELKKISKNAKQYADFGTFSSMQSIQEVVDSLPTLLQKPEMGTVKLIIDTYYKEVFPAFISFAEYVVENNQATERKKVFGFADVLTDFFNLHEISLEVSNIFEVLLFKLVKLESTPKSALDFVDNDLRVNFCFYDCQQDMNQEKASLLAFFQSQGDYSAMITYSEDKQNNTCIINPITGFDNDTNPFNFIKQPLVTYELSVDASILIEKIWPQMQSLFNQLLITEPLLIKSEQEKSKDYFVLDNFTPPVSDYEPVRLEFPKEIKREIKIADQLLKDLFLSNQAISEKVLESNRSLKCYQKL